MPNFELNRNIVSGLELEGAVEGQLTQSLLPQLREVLFSSLVTSFGLDAIIFTNDEANGHVDTLHNVEESQKDGAKPVFKKKEHQDSYDARGEYDSATYHKNSSYIEKGILWNELREAGDLYDTYTGEQILPGQKYDRDHVVAAKNIHDDARNALSGLNGVELANDDTNLTPTDASINRAKKAKTTDQFLRTLKSEHEANLREAAELREAINLGTAPEGADKKLRKLDAKLAVDPDRLVEAEREAKQALTRKHDWAYYNGNDFIGTTSLQAVAAGGKMALKQTTGIILLEMSKAMHQELPALLSHWRETPNWRTKLDPRPILERVAAVLRAAWERISGKVGHILGEATSGFAAGILSEIVTTIINIFTGTAKSIMRLLRNFWAGIINSLKILIFNPDNLGAEEKLAAVMRILSVAIGGMIQPIVAEAIDKLMMAYVGFVPSFLREVLSQFVGAALGGVVSVSLVYAIDHSPVVHRIIEFTRLAGAFTDAVYQNIANLTGLSWQTLKAQTGVLEAQANLAIKMNDLADKQDANYLRYTGMTIRYQIIAHVLSISEDHLATAISTSDNAIALREDTILALRQGFENWEQDGASLSQIISDYKIEE